MGLLAKLTRGNGGMGMQRGFTLVELLIVMGLVSVMTGIVMINLIRPQAQANVSGTFDVLVTDIKAQQLKAMAGNQGSGATAQPHGVYIQSNQYTLFKGATYSAADADNFTISASSGLTLSTTVPSGQLIFTKGSGEVSGFVNGSNTITVTGTGGESKILTINRYGLLTIN